MNNRISSKILKSISKDREIPLSKLIAMLPRLFNDHRDYYPLASLIKNGFISVNIVNEETNAGLEDDREQMIAIRLYAMSQAKHSLKYMGLTFNYSKGTMENEKFYCTAKTDLYFEEQISKRKDRVITIGIGILIGIVSALFASYFSNIFSK
jgi:hypothetical protein